MAVFPSQQGDKGLKRLNYRIFRRFSGLSPCNAPVSSCKGTLQILRDRVEITLFLVFRASIGLFEKVRETMKIRNSLKSLRNRHRDNQLVRRKGRVYIINKTQPRYKARQG